MILGGVFGTITNISEIKGKAGKYVYVSKNNETPIANDSTCLVESFAVDGNYTTIKVWHIANPQNMYTGLMNDQGVVATWNQDYNTSLLTNSDLLSPLASALGAFPYVGSKFSNHVDKQCIALDNSGEMFTNDALVVTFWGTLIQVQLAFVQNQNGTLSQISVRLKLASLNWSDVSFTNLL